MVGRAKKDLYLTMICKQCKREFQAISKDHEFCTSRCDERYQKENLTDKYIMLQVIKDLMHTKEYTTKDEIPTSLIEAKRIQLNFGKESQK